MCSHKKQAKTLHLFSLLTYACAFFIQNLLETLKNIHHIIKLSLNWTKYSFSFSHLLKKLSERSIFIFQWSLTQLSSEKNLTIARKTTFIVFCTVCICMIYFFTKMPASLCQMEILYNHITHSQCLPFYSVLEFLRACRQKGGQLYNFHHCTGQNLFSDPSSPLRHDHHLAVQVPSLQSPSQIHQTKPKFATKIEAL